MRRGIGAHTRGEGTPDTAVSFPPLQGLAEGMTGPQTVYYRADVVSRYHPNHSGGRN